MEGMSKSVLVVVGAMASAMLLACTMAAELTAVEGASQRRTVTLVGAGDIGRCDDRSDTKTARLLGRIPGTVFTLGDHACPAGSRGLLRNCSDASGRKYKKRTKRS